MSQQDVIEFKNLVRSSGIVGDKTVISVEVRIPKAVIDNTQGALRKVTDHEEVGSIAAAAGIKVKNLLISV